ncbi:MAG: DUF2089 domain-containing protein [Phycisphaerae bacterium]|nr:DUF2089 domain-containing protein [Phycisphaerae bacterium]
MTVDSIKPAADQGQPSAAAPGDHLKSHPLARLPREDLDFIVEFVLVSGSLKELARAYRVSYPTIRSRLDRLIERVCDAAQGRKPDPISELLAALTERGEITPGAARAVRDLVRTREGGSS